MLATTSLDDRFLDRCGCGDELTSDLNFRAAAWLAGLHGEPFLGDASLDLDLVDDADDAASH
jgi:hypothetical protein